MSSKGRKNLITFDPSMKYMNMHFHFTNKYKSNFKWQNLAWTYTSVTVYGRTIAIFLFHFNEYFSVLQRPHYIWPFSEIHEYILSFHKNTKAIFTWQKLSQLAMGHYCMSPGKYMANPFGEPQWEGKAMHLQGLFSCCSINLASRGKHNLSF